MSIKSILCDVYFYFYRFFIVKPKILSKKKTIQYIISNKCCVSRFGDGEIKIIMQTGAPKFQDLNQNISLELSKAFATRNDRLLVCLSNINFSFPKNSNERLWYKNYLFYSFRPAIKKKIIDLRYRYGNTDLTRFYHPLLYQKTDFKKVHRYVLFLKKIWEGRNVLFVEGSKTKLGVGNDLFDNVCSIRRIICPPKNAFAKKEQIINSIIGKYNKNDLVLIALGPTASIITAELSYLTNIQAIDIGHVDVVYLWYINHAMEVINISNKDVNESASKEMIKINFDESVYMSQIVDIIS